MRRPIDPAGSGAVSAPAAPARRASLPGRIVAALAVTLALLALLEFAVTSLDVAPPRPPAVLVRLASDEPVLANSAHLFRFSPRFLWEPIPGAVVGSDAINADGYRGTRYPVERSAALRIAALGDSSTFGLGVEEGEAWPRQLETLLRESGRTVEVVNFGCVGYTLVQGVALYQGRVRDYRPDVVVAAFGAVNEQFSSPGGLSDRRKLLMLSGAALQLRNFLRRYDLFRWLEALRYSSEERAAISAPILQEMRVPVADFRAALAQLKAAVEADGAQLVLVSPPRRCDGETTFPSAIVFTRELASEAPKLGLPLADVRAEFLAGAGLEIGAAFGSAASPAARAAHDALFVDSVHPSPAGHALYARIVGRVLATSGLLERPPK